MIWRTSPSLPLPAIPLGLLLAVLAGCGADAPSSTRDLQPRLVEATLVVSEPFSEHIEVVGQLEALESVAIRSQVAGVLDSVLFEEGAYVAKGRVLFVLDSKQQEASLRHASANLVMAADVYQRTTQLSKVQVSAASELTQAKASVDAAEAAVDLAKVSLTRTRIRAPFDGAVGARYVSPGARIDPDVELVQLDAIDTLSLHFSLPERVMSLARQGLVVDARVGARLNPQVKADEGESFEAEVYFISPTLDPSSRRLSVKARVPNVDRRLRPGSFARVTLDSANLQDALLLPESSVAHDASGVHVWRITGESTAERVAVELGAYRDGRVVIRKGLSAGDQVITSGTHRLHAGLKVEVRTPDIALAN